MLCYRLSSFLSFSLSVYVFSPCSWLPAFASVLLLHLHCCYISIVTILIVKLFVFHAWCNGRCRDFVAAASSFTVLEEDFGLRQTVQYYAIHIKHYTSLHIHKGWKLPTCCRKYFDLCNLYVAHQFSNAIVLSSVVRNMRSSVVSVIIIAVKLRATEVKLSLSMLWSHLGWFDV